MHQSAWICLDMQSLHLLAAKRPEIRQLANCDHESIGAAKSVTVTQLLQSSTLIVAGISGKRPFWQANMQATDKGWMCRGPAADELEQHYGYMRMEAARQQVTMCQPNTEAICT